MERIIERESYVIHAINTKDPANNFEIVLDNPINLSRDHAWEVALISATIKFGKFINHANRIYINSDILSKSKSVLKNGKISNCLHSLKPTNSDIDITPQRQYILRNGSNKLTKIRFSLSDENDNPIIVTNAAYVIELRGTPYYSNNIQQLKLIED